MRIHTGKGYRVYFMQENDCWYILLVGGDKSSQQKILQKLYKWPMKEGKIMQYSKFDIVDYLDSEEAVAAYLSSVLEENDPDLLVAALGDIARARGMAKLARDTGLNRESLYKTLRPGSKPRFDTVFRIMKALNINMQLSAR